MKVGWVGLGKLGLPCALVLAQHHSVYGYDVSDRARRILAGTEEPMQEEGIQELLDSNALFVQESIADVVMKSEIVFVAVQTPHAPAYGGETPVPLDRQDFEYAFLVQACRDVCNEAFNQKKKITLAVVSTVLPGTSHRLIEPLLNRYVDYVYTPQFIAMGTTINDFIHPEFVICGTRDEKGSAALSKVFGPVHRYDILYRCDIETAEAIKVFYNTFISMKIVFANMVMEMCHKTGADSDVVAHALGRATDRVISPKYMRGGMGDGGACHPRDLIALSWLAGRLDLSYDLLGEMAYARQEQTQWLADLVRVYEEQTRFPVVIMGKAYKPGSDLTSGSPALLLKYYLGDLVQYHYDPHVSRTQASPKYAAVYVVATMHPEFANFPYPAGSVVLDPFGYVWDRPGVTVVRIGRK
jgi:UDPglucose 6-dehydrogenase